MAETEIPETLAEVAVKEAPAEDMEVEAQVDEETADDGAGSKRARDEASAEDEENGEGAKKQKVENSVEEERLDKTLDDDKKSESEPDPKPDMGPVTVGPKSFGSSIEMFDYFYKFLHAWTPNINVNKYEHQMLLELLKKGHTEPEKKIGSGISAFQVRYHPQFRSRCYFLIRDDESVDDFSFRKCVDHILPLPESMQIKHDVNKVLGGGRGGWGKGGGGRGGKGGGGGGRGGGRGHWRGRGGKSRN